VYPQFRAKMAASTGVICYSQPALSTCWPIWLADLGSQQNVERVDVWDDGESGGQGRLQMRQVQGKELGRGRSANDHRRLARSAEPETRPQTARVEPARATYDDNPAVFAQLPREVGIWYYHSLLTYTARKIPMIDGPVLREAQSGRWTGVCPDLVGARGVTQPFTSADFIHYRMSEFTQQRTEAA